MVKTDQNPIFLGCEAYILDQLYIIDKPIGQYLGLICDE
jgi:hypothetical protein